MSAIHGRYSKAAEAALITDTKQEVKLGIAS